MADVVLLTGFPGFLGRELLPRVLARAPEQRAVCVVQQKFMGAAREAVSELERRDPQLVGRIQLEAGDITRPDLGLADAASIVPDVVEVHHLAAVYDLSVGRELAMKVNVDGTERVLQLAERCPRLRRHQYVSTCYVSGRHTGIFREDDLEKGQEFNNFYEETKYLAERLVRRRMAEGMPTSIYRPSIVVGDSTDGATQKLDGPYFMLRWLLKQPGPVAVMPMVGLPRNVRFNMVPRDFVVDAINLLSSRDDTVGQCFQLADPEPPTVDEMLTLAERAVGKKVLRAHLPTRFAKQALARVPGMYALTEIPVTAVDYFLHPTHYDTRQTQRALEGSGISVPRFSSYVDRMADFVRSNMALGSGAMV